MIFSDTAGMLSPSSVDHPITRSRAITRSSPCLWWRFSFWSVYPRQSAVLAFPMFWRSVLIRVVRVYQW